jgi:hypothetical protein
MSMKNSNDTIGNRSRYLPVAQCLNHCTTACATRKKEYDLVVVLDLFCITLIWDLACIIDLELHLLEKKMYIVLERDQMLLS